MSDFESYTYGEKDKYYINFDPYKGILEIDCNLPFQYPTYQFKPLYKALELYFNNPQPKTIINIKVKYFNSATSYELYRILTTIKQLFNNNKNNNNNINKIVINWYYDDEENLALGEEYKHLIDLPFNFFNLDK